jgi:hypothetical protein
MSKYDALVWVVGYTCCLFFWAYSYTFEDAFQQENRFIRFLVRLLFALWAGPVVTGFLVILSATLQRIEGAQP